MERGCWTIQTTTRVSETAALIVPRINARVYEERKACDSDLMFNFFHSATSSELTASSYVINDVKYGTHNYEGK